MREYKDHPAFKSGVWYMTPNRGYESGIRAYLLSQKSGIVKHGVLNNYFIFWVEAVE